VAVARLSALINTPVSKEAKAFQVREAARQRKQDRKSKVEAERRRRWIQEMQADPDRIRHPKASRRAN
jgi:hypothetical protein